MEDNELVREMLSEFISHLPDMEMCGAAETAEEAIRDLPATKPDLLIVDMSLPQMNGAELIALVRERWPHILCLVHSAHGESGYVMRARAAGARGYVLKGNPYELPNAIRNVLQGEEYVSESLRY